MGDSPVLWEEGGTRLLDYRPPVVDPGAPAAFIVPSLINRAYILDLSEERSFVRTLARSGFHPLLIDWGDPGPTERGFTLTDYIAGRLERALDVVLSQVRGPVVVVGYCMGGLLGLALALRRQRDVAGLVCLATPWDFHADRPEQARLIGAAVRPLAPLLDGLGELPVDVIQMLFAALDPLQVIRKFLGFADIDPDSPRARLFVALEDWLNDGVPLVAPVAHECLAGWYGDNATARGAWQVAGRPVRPEEFGAPALIVVPDQDRIVPPASAQALAAAIPGAERLEPRTGHIGMVVGSDAERGLMQPLAAWLGGLQGRRSKPVARARRTRRLSRAPAPPYPTSQLQKSEREE
jgi:polyhydroxyalkanoate synthase